MCEARNTALIVLPYLRTGITQRCRPCIMHLIVWKRSFGLLKLESSACATALRLDEASSITIITQIQLQTWLEGRLSCLKGLCGRASETMVVRDSASVFCSFRNSTTHG